MERNEEWNTLYVYCLITLMNDSFLDNSELIDPYLGSIEDSVLCVYINNQEPYSSA